MRCGLASSASCTISPKKNANFLHEFHAGDFPNLNLPQNLPHCHWFVAAWTSTPCSSVCSAGPLLAVSFQEILWIQPRGLRLHWLARARTVCAEPKQSLVVKDWFGRLKLLFTLSVHIDRQARVLLWLVLLWDQAKALRYAVMCSNRSWCVVPKCLLLWSRVVDYQKWLRADPQGPSCEQCEGVCLRLAHYLNAGELPVIWAGDMGTISSAIAVDAATGPITMTTPTPKLTPLLGQRTAAPCT